MRIMITLLFFLVSCQGSKKIKSTKRTQSDNDICPSSFSLAELPVRQKVDLSTLKVNNLRLTFEDQNSGYKRPYVDFDTSYLSDRVTLKICDKNDSSNCLKHPESGDSIFEVNSNGFEKLPAMGSLVGKNVLVTARSCVLSKFSKTPQEGPISCGEATSIITKVPNHDMSDVGELDALVNDAYLIDDEFYQGAMQAMEHSEALNRSVNGRQASDESAATVLNAAKNIVNTPTPNLLGYYKLTFPDIMNTRVFEDEQSSLSLTSSSSACDDDTNTNTITDTNTNTITDTNTNTITDTNTNTITDTNTDTSSNTDTDTNSQIDTDTDGNIDTGTDSVGPTETDSPVWTGDPDPNALKKGVPTMVASIGAGLYLTYQTGAHAVKTYTDISSDKQELKVRKKMSNALMQAVDANNFLEEAKNHENIIKNKQMAINERIKSINGLPTNLMDSTSEEIAKGEKWKADIAQYEADIRQSRGYVQNYLNQVSDMSADFNSKMADIEFDHKAKFPELFDQRFKLSFDRANFSLEYDSRLGDGSLSRDHFYKKAGLLIEKPRFSGVRKFFGRGFAVLKGGLWAAGAGLVITYAAGGFNLVSSPEEAYVDSMTRLSDTFESIHTRSEEIELKILRYSK